MAKFPSMKTVSAADSRRRSASVAKAITRELLSGPLSYRRKGSWLTPAVVVHSSGMTLTDSVEQEVHDAGNVNYVSRFPQLVRMIEPQAASGKLFGQRSGMVCLRKKQLGHACFFYV